MALAASREPMAMGMVHSPRWAARLEGSLDLARGDPSGDVAGSGQQPGWLTAAVEEAERGVAAQAAEPPADPPATRAAIQAEQLADRIEQRQSAWLDRLGRPRRDAAVRQLVSVLPQQPVIDVATAQRLTGKSHVAVGRALQQLERTGVLNRLSERKWGRVWECDELFALVESFEKSVRTRQQ